MKITWNKQPDEVVAHIKNDLDKAKGNLVKALAKDICQNTRRNYLRIRDQIPAMDDFIDVWYSTLGKDSAKVVCGGTQLLFVEFGAGMQNSMKEVETARLYYNDDFSVKNVVWITRDIPAHGFSLKSNRLTEEAPRPNGIVGLGQYGKGLGKDSSWIFSDVNLIPDNGVNHTHMIRATNNYFVYRTSGIAPQRILWRARNTSINKLLSGRLRIK